MPKYLNTLDLRVDKLIWRGRGLARTAEGKATIVEPGVLPGERIRAGVYKEKKDHLLARAVQILESNPGRRSHPCVHGPDCGACPLAIIPNRSALQIKKDILLDTLNRQLSRELSVKAAAMLKIHPSTRAWRYRFRGQVHVLNGKPHFMQSSANIPVPFRDCKIFARPLNAVLEKKSAGVADGRQLIAASPYDGEVAWAFEEKKLVLPLDPWGIRLYINPDSFFQANWGQNKGLVSLILDSCAGYFRVADLYAGSGNFSLPLAASGHEVLAVEGSNRAVQEGKENAKINKVQNVEFIRTDLSRPGKSWQPVSSFSPQCVVADPPRSGGGKAVHSLKDIPGLERIVWVSCDIVNSCRDLKPLLEQGWELSAVHIVDMFPQTWHMEVVILLDKIKAGTRSFWH
ncbi:MAG: class I SAM-dependent RNA methyltransferase [Desulfonatronovibrionaceae bacterium]